LKEFTNFAVWRPDPYRGLGRDRWSAPTARFNLHGRSEYPPAVAFAATLTASLPCSTAAISSGSPFSRTMRARLIVLMPTWSRRLAGRHVLSSMT
jgi:hypothetical protein